MEPPPAAASATQPFVQIIPSETSFSNHKPPQAALDDPLSAYWQPDPTQAQALEAFQTGVGPDPRSDEPDLQPDVGKRFDEPNPVQLEIRGVTAHRVDHGFHTQHPESQQEFWSCQTAWKYSVAAKLRLAGRLDVARALED